MKTLLALVLAVVAHGALAQSVELHVMHDGTRPAVDNEQVVAALVGLVESASVDSTSYVRPAERWEKTLGARVFIHALFDAPREISLRMQNDVEPLRPSAVSEIVVMFPAGKWPSHIFVKTGDEVRSVTKYSPCALERVVKAAKLESIVRVELVQDYCRREAA